MTDMTDLAALVPTAGFTHSDHRHPGSKMKRPIVKPSRRTISTLVLPDLVSRSAAKRILSENSNHSSLIAPPLTSKCLTHAIAASRSDL